MADDIGEYTSEVVRRMRERQSKLREFERKPTPMKTVVHVPSSPVRIRRAADPQVEMQMATASPVITQLATTSPLKSHLAAASPVRGKVVTSSPVKTLSSSGSFENAHISTASIGKVQSRVSTGAASKVPSKSTLPKPATPRPSSSKIAESSNVTKSFTSTSKTEIVRPDLSKTSVLKAQVSKEQLGQQGQLEPHSLSVMSKKELFEQKMAIANQPPPVEPEKLSVRSKKSMFENLMRQESDEKRKCITRNEYLARKKAQAKSPTTQLQTESQNTQTKVVSPAKLISTQPMTKFESPTKSPLQPPQPPPQPPSQPLPIARQYSSRSMLTKVSQNVLKTIPDDDYEQETMSLCSQESEELKSNPDEHIYPGLPSLDEAESLHSGSPEKRSRHSDEDADFDNDAYHGDCDENVFTATPVIASPGYCNEPNKVTFYGDDYSDPVPSSSSGHGSETFYVDQAASTTPYRRTISNYRLQQKLIRQQQEREEAQALSGMKRNMSQLEIWEKRKRQELQLQIAELKKKELPKLDQTIKQAKAALMICLESSEFKDTASHADAERALFVNELKKYSIMAKIDRLTGQLGTGFTMGTTDQVTGTLQFDKIELPILRDLAVTSKKGLTPKTVETHFYYCVVSHDGTVHSTECLSLKDGYDDGLLRFKVPGTFKFTNLKSDFSLKLDVYEITMIRPAKKEHKKVHLPHLSKKKTNEVHHPTPSDVFPRSVLRGSVEINALNMRRKEFELKDFVYENALIGRVHLGLTTVANYETQYGNFLHFYDEGDGTWKRRWCRIQGPKILAWRHLEDEEAAREPLDSIDLRHCINPVVESSPYNVCSRRESFIMLLAGTDADRVLLRVNWLCHKNYSDIVEKQILAADMIQEKNEWMAKINTILEGMRVWDPEVLIPCSAAEMQKFIHQA